MASIWILHGTGGAPQENWFPWLKAELEKRGHTVAVPALPNASHPNEREWLQALNPSSLGPQSILIGHSLGATLAMRVLEIARLPILGTFLIAPVSEPMGNAFDPLVESFIGHPFSWNLIQGHGGKIEIFHGDDDPYVPLSHARRLADTLAARLNVIGGGKHLNASTGWTTFPLLLQHILRLTGSTE